MNKKTYGLLLVIGLLLVGAIGLGFSYALWVLSYEQENKNVVMSDCFKITFEEKNEISLQRSYPMDDKKLYDFYNDATPYHFVVENVCDNEANVVINLETLADENKLDDKYIETVLFNGTKSYREIADNKTEKKDVYSASGEKRAYQGVNGEVNFYNYQLTNNPINTNKVIEEAITAYKLYQFKLKGKEKREFNLLQYVWQDAPPSDEVMNKVFKGKITLTSAYQPPVPMNALAARGCDYGPNCRNTKRVFQKEYFDNTTKIVFQNEMNPPSEFVAEFDESFNNDGSVKAYVVRNEDNTTYTIYFQTKGNFGMTSGRYYFDSFSKVTEIEGLEYVDTSSVTDMKHMFSYMNSLTSLDLSYFDTSSVTNMDSMFSNVSSLIELDLSNFDTSQVEKMNYMFYDMSSLTSLDLSFFDTGNVTDMSYMFHGMSSLTSLDLSNFDTSNVTSMNYMFYDMSSLTSLDLSSFDTSNVTDMGNMFENMRSLITLDLSNFDTSNVTSMNYMFEYMISLISLNISNFNTSKVGGMCLMFGYDSKLTNIVYGENFIRRKSSDTRFMFQNCPANKPQGDSWGGAF